MARILPTSRYYGLDTVNDQTLPRPRTYLAPRTPARYRPRPDNTPHIVREGDTLDSIAHRHFAGLGAGSARFTPEQLYWVIADFQPQPILDATIQLRPGTTLILPSQEFVLTEVLG